MKNNCIEDNLPCCGCAACAVVCPNGAAGIELSEDGYYKAVLDTQKCTNCALCKGVCPKYAQNYPQENKSFEALPLYCGWSKNEVSRAKSTSGGVAHEIAVWGLGAGYKIAGTVYNAKSRCAQVVIAERERDLEAFRGSKYIQSISAEAFKTIAQSRDKFIFFGAPCQCAALKLLAQRGKFEDRVIIVDFFCHGVPTKLLWDICRKEAEEFLNEPLERVDFRSKKYGWNEFTMLVAGGTKSRFIKATDNAFYTLFFSDALLNDSCYACEAKKSFAFADIRIGDAWGADIKDEEKGVSVAAALTKKGDIILKTLRDNNSIELLPLPHKVCLKNQAAFKDTSFDKSLRAQLFAAMRAGAATRGLIQIYFSNITVKKLMFLRLKNLLPLPLKRAARKIYRSLK